MKKHTVSLKHRVFGNLPTKFQYYRIKFRRKRLVNRVPTWDLVGCGWLLTWPFQTVLDIAGSFSLCAIDVLLAIGESPKCYLTFRFSVPFIINFCSTIYKSIAVQVLRWTFNGFFVLVSITRSFWSLLPMRESRKLLYIGILWRGNMVADMRRMKCKPATPSRTHPFASCS